MIKRSNEAKRQRTDSEPVECTSALVVLGTYQGLMIGLVLRGGRFYMKFSTKHHVGSLHAVAVTEKLAASCGSDERLFLFTNKLAASTAKRRGLGSSAPSGVRMADLGSLAPPSEVVCLSFASASQFLFCGAGDGRVVVYRTRDWTATAAMVVHEQAVTGLAVHPRSQGAMAITVGADRMVAVLDVVKERLITKWKYLSGNSPAKTPDSATRRGSQHTKNEGEEEGEDEGWRVPKLLRREVPKGVDFSETGEHFVVYSSHAFEVFCTATMRLVLSFRQAVPQPDDEIHVIRFLDCEDGGVFLLIGDECGRLRTLYVTNNKNNSGEEESKAASPKASKKKVRVEGKSREQEKDEEDSTPPCFTDPAALLPVKVEYPEAVREEAKALLARPVQPDVESRRKNPLRHVSRIKAMCQEGPLTLFTLDSRGIVVCWRRRSADAGSLVLEYVTSANCQGRATSMASMRL